jgi:hypothetical protein
MQAERSAVGGRKPRTLGRGKAETVSIPVSCRASDIV